MADNNFRSYRGRDPVAPNASRSAHARIDDPLGELARLIGQSGKPAADYGSNARYSETNAAPDAGADWAADDRYAEQTVPARDRYDLPRASGYTPPVGRAPARLEPRFSDAPQDYTATEEPRYRDDPEPAVEHDREMPAISPPARDARYAYDNSQGAAEDPNYALEDYQEENASPRRRGGVVVVAAVLCLAVLGTAGAFAYRAMYGGSMLPALPPIIKAEDGPNKIMPNYGDSHGTPPGHAGGASTGSGEKLVSREEKPVDVPAPVTATPPRVVSTIPIFPAPTPGAPGAPPITGATPNALAPVAPAPAAPVRVAPVAAAPAASTATPQPPVAAPEPKKIHTVAIRPDQPSGTDTAAAPAPPAPPVRTATPHPAAPAAAAAPRASPAPAPQAGSNGPLEIVPAQGDAAPPAAPVRTRTAVARPTATTSAPAPASEPAASAGGGGYAVQVTSQRSEAEAQSAYRALAAKYPDQLGGHAPIVRRADLGAKGIYYRALVGPFASMEQAAGMCSSLKAAGGSCIVQKD